MNKNICYSDFNLCLSYCSLLHITMGKLAINDKQQVISKARVPVDAEDHSILHMLLILHGNDLLCVLFPFVFLPEQAVSSRKQAILSGTENTAIKYMINEE